MVLKPGKELQSALCNILLAPSLNVKTKASDQTDSTIAMAQMK
jgi:hypothetical protein